jgi:hypothetical protein
MRGNVAGASLPITCVTKNTTQTVTLRGDILTWAGGGGANAPPIFFLPKNRFLATELQRGK